jgi:hypothetical protein
MDVNCALHGKTQKRNRDEQDEQDFSRMRAEG